LGPDDLSAKPDYQSDQRDEQTVFDHRRAALVPMEAVDKCEHRGSFTSVMPMTGSNWRRGGRPLPIDESIVDETKRFRKIFSNIYMIAINHCAENNNAERRRGRSHAAAPQPARAVAAGIEPLSTIRASA